MARYTYLFTPCAGNCMTFCIGHFAMLSCLIVSMMNTIDSIMALANLGCGAIIPLTFQGCLLIFTSLWLLFVIFSAYRSSPTVKVRKIIYHLSLGLNILFTVLWLISLVLSVLECPLLCQFCPNPVPGNNSDTTTLIGSSGSPCQCWTFQTVTEEMYNILTKITPHFGLAICFAIKSIEAFRKCKNINPSNDSAEGYVLEERTGAGISPVMSTIDSLQITQ